MKPDKIEVADVDIVDDNTYLGVKVCFLDNSSIPGAKKQVKNCTFLEI